MTTPADELRTAAHKLRALLTDRQLTPGPWLSMDRGDRLLWNGPGAEDQPPRYVVDEPMGNAVNAAYIAAMHPDVGKALAELLEEAARLEAYTLAEFGHRGGGGHHPLAVARAINGGEPR